MWGFVRTSIRCYDHGGVRLDNPAEADFHFHLLERLWSAFCDSALSIGISLVKKPPSVDEGRPVLRQVIGVIAVYRFACSLAMNE